MNGPAPTDEDLPARTGCRVLLVNPNTTAAITERMVAVARGVAAPGTDVRGIEAERGVPYIASRPEAALAGATVLELLAAEHTNCDVAVIAAFGDPGLFAARELLPIPVIGLAEAALLTACMLGRRFAIVSFATVLGGWYRDCVALHGLESRLASVRLVTEPFASVEAVARDKRDALLALARDAVEHDGADAIVMAGAPLAGLAPMLQGECPVPLIDPVAAALTQAEAIWAQGLARPRPAAPNGDKASTGLSAPLAALLRSAPHSR
jgi:allantoin racemase